MILTFFGKKEPDIRKNILRGVFEENRLILGRGRPALALKRSFPFRKIFISVLLCILGVLFYGEQVDTSFSPPRMDTRLNLPRPRVLSEGPVNTSEISALESTPNFPLSRMLGLKIRTIMIDAGHGGAELGCVGQMGTKEKDITLDIAKRVRAHLIKTDHHHVLMTREDDRSVALEKRVALAGEAKADVFISIHVNSVPVKDINIIETYYFGPSTDKKALELAGQENAGSEYGLSDFKELIKKLGKTMKLQESKDLATAIQDNLFMNSRRNSKEIRNHGVKRAPFVVLLGPDVPSVLVEVSCLSNREEEQELNSETHRENIARYISGGIFNYLDKGGFSYAAKH